MKKREADAVKKSSRSSGGRKQASNLMEASKIPGVKRVPRKRGK